MGFVDSRRQKARTYDVIGALFQNRLRAVCWRWEGNACTYYRNSFLVFLTMCKEVYGGHVLSFSCCIFLVLIKSGD